MTPGWDEGPWASSLSFAPRRCRRRTSGRGQAMDTGQELHLRHQSNLQSVRPLISCDLVSHRARVPSRRVLCAGPPGHLTLSVAPLASPIPDPSRPDQRRSLSTPVFHSVLCRYDELSGHTDDLDLFRVPPSVSELLMCHTPRVPDCSSRSPPPAPGRPRPCVPSPAPGLKTVARCSASPPRLPPLPSSPNKPAFAPTLWPN